MVTKGNGKEVKSGNDTVGYGRGREWERKIGGRGVVRKEGIKRGAKVRGRKRDKLRSFTLNDTIKKEVMVENQFSYFDLYLG